MDKETYEQIEISLDFIGEKIALLQDGMDVEIESHEGTPINIALPDHITLVVRETEPTVKGQTAAASYKPAILENGLNIQFNRIAFIFFVYQVLLLIIAIPFGQFRYFWQFEKKILSRFGFKLN